MHMLAGVDGCRGSWLVAWAEDDGLPTLTISPTFTDVIQVTANALLVLVDIPIGLTDHPVGRRCDRMARAILGGRHVTVFRPPTRRALDFRTRQEASAVNQSLTGRGIGAQSFAILPKIHEVDLIMRADPRLQSRIREMHPEVSFAALNQWRTLKPKKDDPVGHRIRLSLLEQYAPTATRLVHESRTKYGGLVAPDDIADALVALVTAHLAWTNRLPTIPPDPDTDPFGLRMEMVTPFPPPVQSVITRQPRL